MLQSNANSAAKDRDSTIGQLDTAWGEEADEGWRVVGMKDDWNQVFPFGE